MSSNQGNNNFPIKPISHVWRRLLLENRVPMDGVIVEVAPGYETKIGDALALLEFHGTIILVEPDPAAAAHIEQAYKRILPFAEVRAIIKPLQEIEVGSDVPEGVAAIVANHPFDDMVLGAIVGVSKTSFFSQERQDGTNLSSTIQKIYDAVSDNDYVRGILMTVTVWKDLIQKMKPACFIASQYPSHRLSEKGLTKRQNSGYMAMEFLREFYEKCLSSSYDDKSFGFQDEPMWWIITRKPYVSLSQDLAEKPQAIERLGSTVFVPQSFRHLEPEEYDVVFVDTEYFADAGYQEDIWSTANNFAIVLDHQCEGSVETTKTYADRQQDKTGISLTGNLGSGRAVYYGDRYNIIGVGKTTLCTSAKPSHSTGTTDLVGALRRVVLSRWINYFTHRAVQHPVVIAKKVFKQFKWSEHPIPLALLVRIDEGSLDRPTHIEYSPNIDVDFDKILYEYAHLDAEYFAYRFMLGAWSTGNYSLKGDVIDLETASFVKYRGPYTTATDKHKEDFFGYEGMGFILILRQLAEVKRIKIDDLEERFYRERREHLARCFLTLLGIDAMTADAAFATHKEKVLELAMQFELLAKKISPKKWDLDLYCTVFDEEDPALLDMSNLFKSLWLIQADQTTREEQALTLLVRNSAMDEVLSGFEYDVETPDDVFIRDHAVITKEILPKFLAQTRVFIQSLFEFLDLLEDGHQLPKGEYWKDRLMIANQDFPPLNELNIKLKYWVEEYRTDRIRHETLGFEIEKLCQLPHYPTGISFQLRDIPLLNHMRLSDKEMTSVSRLFETLSYNPGEEIVHSGDEADSLYVLVQGTLAVITPEGHLAAKLTNRGLLMGETTALGSGFKRTATVAAETSAILLRITRGGLDELITLHPESKTLLENVLKHKMAGIDQKVLNLKAFRGIDPEDLRLFLAEKAETRYFKAGDKLILQGEQTEGAHLLMSGSVELEQTSKETGSGAVLLTDLPLERGLFGEWSIISNGGASCNVISCHDSSTLYLPKDTFLALLKRYPQCLDNCLNRIRSYSEANSKRQDLATRFRNGLLKMDLSAQTLTLIDECCEPGVNFSAISPSKTGA